jgi:protein-disulfide isomerase
MFLVRKTFVAAAVWLACSSVAAAQQEPAAIPARETVESIVRDYLLRNPEVIIEAIEEYKRQDEERQRLASEQAVRERADEIYRDPSSPIGGNPDGDVVLVEFFDYRCGVCKRVHPLVEELVKTDPGIKRVYKEWPILGPESVFAARAALASRAQGKYVEFHRALMGAKRNFDPQAVIEIARAVGLDTKRLQRDMNDPDIEAAIGRNFALAEALHLNGTPSFVIGDTLLRGGRDLDTLRELVARARKPG